MLRQNALKFFTLLACGALAGWLLRADTPAPARPTAADLVTASNSARLSPGPNDGHIAYLAARLLEKQHYLQHSLDDEYSEKFLDRYMESLDPQHLHFTEADFAEFASYRTNLDNLTITRRGEADTRPAYRIFTRFLERFEQRVAYVTELLKNEKFEFNTDERMGLSRREAPYPRDLNEARQLWRQRLRFEYLQEKLGKLDAKTNLTAAATKNTNSATSQPVTKRIESKPAPPKEVKNKSDAEEIVELLTRRYNRTLHSFKEWDTDDVLQIYLTALAHVYDPHSDYFNKSGADNFAIGMNLALFGIGAELRSEDGYCTISKLVPNGPAAKSKQVQPGDRIVAVAQSNGPPADVMEMNLNKVVQLIRGPKDTEVRLTIMPAAATERRIVTLQRDEIKLEDKEAKAKIIEIPNNGKESLRLGLIELPSFYATIDLNGNKHSDPDHPAADRPTVRSTTADVARLLKKLTQEKVNGIMLDLRHNGGGSLEEATTLASLFIKGPVVQVRAPNRAPAVLEDRDTPVLYTGPLIVLTTRDSASASEIVAGALQDYGRALIVGDISTFGKGTVQNLNPLRPWIEPATATATNDPGTLKITIRKYYRPSGTSTLFKGVMPDIVLPSILNYSEDIGESALDTALGNDYSKNDRPEADGNSLGRDSIRSARFDKLDLVEPYLTGLLTKSNQRVATNQDFVYLREDIEQFRKLQADKTVSLNEKQRLKEKNEDDARKKTREKERLARRELDQKVYELKLSQVDLPGLPPPIVKSNSITEAKSAVQGGSARNLTNFSAPAKLSIGNSAANDGTVSTNQSGLVKAAAPKASAGDEDEIPAGVDTTLEEAENILVDYIKLLAQKELITSNR